MMDQLDLTVEARHLDRFADMFRENPHIVIPKPDRELSNADVLVEDYIDGVNLLRAVGTPAAKKIADWGTKAVLRMIFQENFVHADLHPGNVLWLQDGTDRLAFIDAGLCLELGDKIHHDMVGVLRAMTERRGADAARIT